MAPQIYWLGASSLLKHRGFLFRRWSILWQNCSRRIVTELAAFIGPTSFVWSFFVMNFSNCTATPQKQSSRQGQCWLVTYIIHIVASRVHCNCWFQRASETVRIGAFQFLWVSIYARPGCCHRPRCEASKHILSMSMWFFKPGLWCLALIFLHEISRFKIHVISCPFLKASTEEFSGGRPNLLQGFSVLRCPVSLQHSPGHGQVIWTALDSTIRSGHRSSCHQTSDHWTLKLAKCPFPLPTHRTHFTREPRRQWWGCMACPIRFQIPTPKGWVRHNVELAL